MHRTHLQPKHYCHLLSNADEAFLTKSATIAHPPLMLSGVGLFVNAPVSSVRQVLPFQWRRWCCESSDGMVFKTSLSYDVQSFDLMRLNLQRLEEARIALFSKWSSAVLAWNREETRAGYQWPSVTFYTQLLVRRHSVLTPEPALKQPSVFKGKKWRHSEPFD